MPDANGKFKGSGWTRRSEAAWERVFGRPAEPTCQAYGWPPKTVQECCGDACVWTVPAEPSPEVSRRGEGEQFGDLELADDPTDEAYWFLGRDPDEEADDQAARDGYNPEW